MKRINIKLADGLAVILLILSAFAPYVSPALKLNPNILIMLINCYIIGYMSYLISFMDTKKVLMMAIPLLVYTIFLVFLLNDFKIGPISSIVEKLTYIITSKFDVIFVVFVFFLLELGLNRLLGPTITTAIAAIGFLLYLLMQNTDLIPFDIYYKDLLVYFMFYVMAARIRPANSIHPALHILALVLFIGEIVAVYHFNYYPGIYFSVFLLTYIILKDTIELTSLSFERYLSLAYLYPYRVIATILMTYINTSPAIITSLAVLLTFVIAQLFYKLRLKVLDYLFVGVH